MKLSLSVRALALALALLAPGARLEAKVGALGRIIPAGDLITLGGDGSAVAAIHVKEGDVVAAGAPLIDFNSRHTAENEVKLAELSLREARDLCTLATHALAKKSEIAKGDYEFAVQRYERFSKLGGEKVSAQQMELRAYQMKNAQLVQQAADLDLARSREDGAIKLARAEAQLAAARAKLDATTLRSPAPLTVVKVNATPGTVPGGAVVVLANLSEMLVLTEVFAGDLPSLKVGQAATITSNALAAPIAARVLSIGRLITGRAKVAEILLRLDDPTAAAKLLHLEVNVSIEN
ncbi:MAG: hypothetical protein RLZZ15_450 [Verrucomicrobiota bacterium]|jgi:multidrug resistance efflux pump